MHPDHRSYVHYTSPARLDKSVNSLLGIVQGIAIDQEINAAEMNFLRMWLADHEDVQDLHPFNELAPVVGGALADGLLTEDERDDILWLCGRISSTEYYDKVTADLQRLHAVVGGIVADGKVSKEELRGLSAWLQDNEHLRSCWPYDEIDTLITGILADGRIDEQEHEQLKTFFSEFVVVLDERVVRNPPVLEAGSIVGLCVVCPEIRFEGSRFCFTGASARYTRSQFASAVSRFGGQVVASVSAKLDYLVVGADGNPCWAYACYGRKVARAVELRKAGARLLIVHENDLHDAISDRE